MDIGVILAYASAVFGVALAFAVAWQERRSVAHWAFGAGMVVLAVERACSGLSADSVLPQEIVYWQNWRLSALCLVPGTWLIFSLIYARGNYRESLRKWRVLLVIAFLAPIGLAIAVRGQWFVSISTTASGQHLLALALAGFLLNLLFLLSAVWVLMNLEGTYRASVGTMRWRIKFMILGLAVLFASGAYVSSQALVSRTINLTLDEVNSAAMLVACLLIAWSLSRTGHFEVSVYPSRFVLHSSLTLVLAGVYLLIVGVLAKVVAFLGGDSGFALKAFLVLLALVLLTGLVLSERVQLYTKRFVSRHFQRPLYDYRSVWRAFTDATAQQVEQTGLCGAIVKLVSELFQTLSVTLWLVDERKEKLSFAASTSLSEPRAAQLGLDAADSALVVTGLRGHPEPSDLDASTEIWAVVLRRLHPDEFRQGGNRISVPLLAGGELLGVMIVGDRVAGVPCSVQELDLLKSVGDQAAACLLNNRLSQSLSQAKQLEAFQAMSAFLVHDLKNTASTLSLMLKNLPVHYEDPNFRADALRGIAKTVTHLNDVIGRLNVFRHELHVCAVECDLNEVVTDTLKGQEQTTGVELVKELAPLPKVLLDPAQIQKVITNLVLNAREALGAGGQIRVKTSRRNGWAELAVADNGCGMTPEFIQTHLFHPFETTKKTGIGIGMFQCKTIVEAHRGKIEVESEVGKGTEFRVLLPV